MSQEAISVGPSLDILEETPTPDIVEVSPATSSEDVQEAPTEDTPSEPSENTETSPKPSKMGEGEAESEDKEGNDTPEDGSDEKAEDGEVPPVDVGKYSAEFFENDGTLSEDSYAELEARGLGKDVVDMFMAGVQALQTQRGETLVDLAGGQEGYDAMVSWGTKNLSEAEQAQFNSAIDQAILEGDSTAVSMLIPGIKARMSSEPSYVNTDNNPNSGGVRPFANKSEMMEAMRDPRYRKDGAYVASVQQRLAISEF